MKFFIIVVTILAYISYMMNIVIDYTVFFVDKFHFILFSIGLFMIILNIFVQKKYVSPFTFTKLKIIWKNKKVVFVLFLFIIIINIITNFLGIGIAVDKSNIIAFLYTLFCKIILLKIIFILLIYLIKGSVNLEFICLNIKNVILFFIIGYFNYYYFIPFISTSG